MISIEPLNYLILGRTVVTFTRGQKMVPGDLVSNNTWNRIMLFDGPRTFRLPKNIYILKDKLQAA